MKQDERGLAVSTDSTEAVTLFDRAVEHFLKFHADTMALVVRAIAADPDFVMGHCLKAYLLLMAANPANRAQIDATLAQAQAGAANLTTRERLHLAAATAWHQGRIERSFQIWRQILDADPTDLLAFRICDTIWFRHGQTRLILEQADRVAPRWSTDLPGYDCARTIWAFAHEEVGDTKGAERAVDAALECDPTNYFAHHVKAHVLDTDGRAREGNEWLASQVVNWSLGNNLIHHLWWHRTLMQLDLGQRDAVLASYDENIRNFNDPMTKATPDHYVDLQNACALLWRLEAQGLAVGDRWDELADKAEARIGEAGHLLMVPHLMMALAATGRDAAAARFLAALRELAADSELWTAPAIAGIVIPACEAALAHRRNEHARVVELLEPRQDQIRLLGGSNAQRDLFFQMLIDSAMKADRRDVVSTMIAHETAARSVAPSQRAGYAAAARWLHS
jgi:tetratricopeptide (TPR) repeat protein